MQIYAGKNCRVYRDDGEGKQVLTPIPFGEPVPELIERSGHLLTRLEKRGIIRIGWDDNDPLTAQHRPKQNATTQAREPKPKVVAAQKPVQGAASYVEQVVKTTRGLTTHMVAVAARDGEVTASGRLLCGRPANGVSPIRLTPDEQKSAKLCSLCGQKYAQIENLN